MDSEIIPFQLHLAVGHKNQAATSTSGYNGLVLPKDPVSNVGPLSLRYVTVRNGPASVHGFLRYPRNKSIVSFPEVLQMFSLSYGQSLQERGLMLSSQHVAGVFFNHCNRQGRRFATNFITPGTTPKNESIFNHVHLRHISNACNCGCNQNFHGPSAVLVLLPESWHRNTSLSTENLALSYEMMFKDEANTKLLAHYDSHLIRAIIYQQTDSIAVKKVSQENIESLCQQTEALKLENMKYKAEVKAFKAEKQDAEKEHSQEIAEVRKLNIELGGRDWAINEFIRKLKYEVEGLSRQLKDAGIKPLRYTESSESSESIGQHLTDAVESATAKVKSDFDELYHSLELENQTVRSRATDLEKQLLGMRSEVAANNESHQSETASLQLRLTEVLKVNNENSNDKAALQSRVEFLVKENRHLTMTHANTADTLERVARNSFILQKSADTSMHRLRIVQGHVNNNDPYLVMHYISKLQDVSKIGPFRMTSDDIRDHIRNVPDSPPSGTTDYSVRVDVREHGTVIQTEPNIRSFDRGMQEKITSSEQDSKKRKLDQVSTHRITDSSTATSSTTRPGYYFVPSTNIEKQITGAIETSRPE